MLFSIAFFCEDASGLAATWIICMDSRCQIWRSCDGKIEKNQVITDILITGGKHVIIDLLVIYTLLLV
jgi:hypothetical protein